MVRPLVPRNWRLNKSTSKLGLCVKFHPPKSAPPIYKPTEKTKAKSDARCKLPELKWLSKDGLEGD